MSKKYIPEKGDIIWLDFDPQLGKEMAKRRPALVVSGADYNKYGLALICPITSKIKGYPFEIKINNSKIEGAILADHIKNLDWIQRKAKFITKCNHSKLFEVVKLLSLLLKL